jgi:hypothetical protein
VKLSPQALAGSPELAAVAVLDTALTVTVRALAAVWPELQHGSLPYEEQRIAFEIIELAETLAAAIRRYRRAVDIADRRERDLPF